MGEIPELVGIIIRWIIVFNCSKKKMDEAHNQNYDKESHRDFIVGLICIMLIIVGIIIYQIFRNQQELI
jgi:hypothetical protein